MQDSKLYFFYSIIWWAMLNLKSEENSWYYFVYWSVFVLADKSVGRVGWVSFIFEKYYVLLLVTHPLILKIFNN